MRRRIKIMYAYTGFYRGGGGEMHSLLLAKHIDRTRFELSVCAIENSRSIIRTEIERSGCPVYDLGLSRKLHTGLNAVRIVAGFYRLFKRLEPDVVQTQALHTNLCARLGAILAGVPIIVSTENSLRNIERRLSRRIANEPFYLASDLLDRWSQGICVVSEFIGRQKNLHGTANKIWVLPAFFDMESFLRSGTRRLRQPFAELRNPIIAIVGRLSPEKGHSYLISAMSEIVKFAPGTRLLIVGSGPQEEKLRHQVNSLAIQQSVEFVGYRRDVFSILAEVDALFVPSLSEAIPVVIVEGMAMAVPVVAARVGGIPEVVSDMETGILVEPGDVGALVNAMEFLLTHPVDARRLAGRAREHALSQFQPERFVKRHEQLYERLGAEHLRL